MKTYHLLLMAITIASTACGINNTASNGGSAADSISGSNAEGVGLNKLYAIMQIEDTIKIGEPLELKFTVKNDADSAQRFLRWDTPYEPLLGKYLDVKDENGIQVDYIGAMAKRRMPPPADDHTTVQAGDSLQSTVDLLKGYAITKPSRYTIVYVGGNMSGLVARDSVSFVYIK